MITVKVGDTPLYIPKETTLVLEQHNNAINPEEFTGDIVWTFEIPAQLNQNALGAVQFAYAGSVHSYPCKVLCNNIPILDGTLYVQSSTDEKRLQCGIVANPFGGGFGDRNLNENKYGDDIVISDNIANHQSAWKQFLESTLANESNIKFFLFESEEFGGDNEHFGYHINRPSGLEGTYHASKNYKYVNRLFFNAAGEVYNNPDTTEQGVRLFNRAGSGKTNGYHFAPAIRLDWLILRILDNAGLSAFGHFFSDMRIHKLFSQSLCTLDGNASQYQTNTWIFVNGNVNPGYQTQQNTLSFASDAAEGQFSSFGWNSGVSIGFKLPLADTTLQRNIPRETTNSYYVATESADEIIALVVGTAGAEMPSLRMSLNQTESDGTKVFKYGKPKTKQELEDEIGNSGLGVEPSVEKLWSVGNGTANVEYTYGDLWTYKKTLSLIKSTQSLLVQLTPSKSKNVNFHTGNQYLEGAVLQLTDNGVSSTTPQFIQLVKCRVVTTKGSDLVTRWSFHQTNISDYGVVEFIDNYEYITGIVTDGIPEPLNIFATVMRWRDHVPDLSNADFLALMCKLFGLSLFVDTHNREIQLNFFTDTLKGSCIDISQWVIHTERLEYAPKRYEVTLEPIKSASDITERNILNPVATKASLPAAGANRGKYAFVQNEKVYRHSERGKMYEQDTEKDLWQPSKGDNRKLIAGVQEAEDCEQVSISAGVPNMHIADVLLTPKYVCEIDSKGRSPLFDKDFDGKFDFILTQYRGRRLLTLQSSGPVPSAYIEDSNPTIYNEDGTIDTSAISLAADGERSIGSIWLKPLYDFIGNSDSFRFTAVMPFWAWWQLQNCLRPQHTPHSEQQRWIMVNNIKLIPTKLSSEFSQQNAIVVTIEALAMHY